MQELLRLFFDIAVLRGSPRDLPATPRLLIVVSVLYVATSAIQSWLVDGPDRAILRALADLGLTAGYFALILAVGQRRHRLPQTLIALLGVTVLLAPLLIGVNWLLERYKAFELLLVVLSMSLLFWYLCIIGHIARSALDAPWFTGLVVALAYLFVSYQALPWLVPLGG